MSSEVACALGAETLCRVLLLQGQGVYVVTGLCTTGLKRSSCRGPIYVSMGSSMCGCLLGLHIWASLLFLFPT